MAGRRAARAAGNSGQLRIIGGEWRGRKLAFQGAVGLRPTADRVRETLFNWLTPVLQSARCLDLFAGSGALGLEALSRGASSCDFVELDNQSATCIAEQLTLLQCERGQVHCTTADRWLECGNHKPFDIVFLDPPFGKGMLPGICALLEQRQLLAADAYIYLEAGAREAAPEVPSNWAPHREKRAGEVSYRLFVRAD